MKRAAKVGRIPVALALIAYGAVLLTDTLNLTSGAAAYAVRLWPALLVAWGIEYLARSLWAERQSADPPAALRFDWGGAFLLLVVVSLGSGVGAVHGWVRAGGFPWDEPRFTRTETAAVPAAGVTEVRISTPAGGIQLQPSPRAEEISVETRLSARSQQALDQMQPKVTPGPVTTVTVDGLGSWPNSAADYTVYVPTGLKVWADTGSGSIRVHGHTGDLNLTSRSGSIEVTAAAGTLQADSGSGSGAVRDFRGPVTLRTGSGRLEVENADGALRLESGSGTISVREFRSSVEAQTGSGSVRASTDTPLAGDVALRTRSGSISLTVPPASSMQVRASTQSGSINIPGFDARGPAGPGRSGTATVGDGRHQVVLEAGSGSVAVNLR